MRKIVVTFGLISGAISSLTMAGVVTSEFCFTPAGEVIGYSSIVLSFLLVFFGIRSYRDTVAGGAITFGRAVYAGLLITLISSVCYVLTWEIVYWNFVPNFDQKFLAYYLERVRASGATPETIQAELQQMRQFVQMYRNPVFNVAITFIEPLPIGLIMTLVSAAVLRRKNRPEMTGSSVPGPQEA